MVVACLKEGKGPKRIAKGRGSGAVWASSMSRQPTLFFPPISISISKKGFLLEKPAQTGKIRGQRGEMGTSSIKASSKRQVLLPSRESSYSIPLLPRESI
nr:hypothetical protein Q903MT_gene1300 [Picea sitchensis]